MIAVDASIVACLYLPCAHTALVERLLQQDPDWVVPALWRSELRTLLAGHLHRNELSLEEAFEIQSEAESLLEDFEYLMSSHEILGMSERSGCSAFQCEYVALAARLQIRLVTGDKDIAAAFPDIAMLLQDAVPH